MFSIEALESGKVFYLTKAEYFEQKNEVLVEFSNAFSKVIKRFRFFPSAHFPLSFEKQKLSELILSLGFRNFSLEEEENRLVLRTLSFGELKKIGASLAVHSSKMPLLIEPSRAFLFEKNWSFFDSFHLIDDTAFKISHQGEDSKSADFFDLGFFLIKEIPFSQALKINREDSLFLVDSAAWSNILSLPLERIPKGLDEKIDLFLEKIFFSNCALIEFEKSSSFFAEHCFAPLPRQGVVSKIDFSLVWAELFTNNFFNLGPKSMNCSCCAPLTLEARNLLPSTLIKVRFCEDNFFFESASHSFAFNFHNSSHFKNERLSKKREFCLTSLPVGPFFRDDFAQIPLIDARKLISEGKAVLVSSKEDSASHNLSWFCTKNEGFLSKEIRSINASLFFLNSKINFFEQSLFAESSFAFNYFSSLRWAFSQIISSLPKHLTSPQSKFFSAELAKNIISVQEATVSRFKEFSEKEGYRVLHADKMGAFVKGSSSLRLAKSFSFQTKLPMPQVANFCKA
jgi:hypothetical protein